jgi:hypothetical protein
METRRKEKEKKNAFYFSSRKEKPIKKCHVLRQNTSSNLKKKKKTYLLVLPCVGFENVFGPMDISESLSEGLVCLLLLIKINWLLVLPENDYRMDRRAQRR